MDRYNPVLMVTCNGWSLTDPEDPYVISLEHRELGDGGKEVKITLANVGLELLDNPNLQEGKILEWVFGYPGNISPVFTATLFVTEPTFDAYSGLTLTLYGYDAVAKAVWKQRTYTWRDLGLTAEITHSEVAELIAEANGWNVTVEPTREYVTEVHQAGISDWELLHDVLAPDAVAADPNKPGKYRVWFDEADNRLYFAPIDLTAPPVRVYRFGVENEDPVLLHFRPRVNTSKPEAQAASDTNVSDVDGHGNVVEASAAKQTELGHYRVDAPHLTVEHQSAPATSDPASDPPSTTEGQAGVEQAEKQLEYIEADIVVIGDPYIRANDIISVWDVGQKHSGRYLVDEVTHTIGSSGFTTDISGKKDATPVDASGDAEKTGSHPLDKDGEAAPPPAVEFDAPHLEFRTP